MIKQNLRLKNLLNDKEKIDSYFSEQQGYYRKNRAIILSTVKPNDIVLLVCGKEQCASDKKPIKQIATINSLHYVFNGEGFLEIDNKKIRIQAGDMFLIPADKAVHYYPNVDNPWQYIFFAFGGVLQESLIRAVGLIDANYVLSVKKYPKIKELFFRIYDRAYSYGKSNLKTLASVYELFGEIKELSARGTVQNKKEQYVSQAINFIMSNIETVTVLSTAENCSLSADYLSKVCKKILGITLQETIIAYKMIIAQNYLKYTTSSIKKIATMIGYSDKKTFIKIFKSIYGETPTMFREKIVSCKEEDDYENCK